MTQPEDTDWIAITEPLGDDTRARVLTALEDQDIEARAAEGAVEVPAALESDAVAIVSGVLGDGADEVSVDRAMELALLTEPVTPDRVSGCYAMDLVMALRLAGLEATSDGVEFVIGPMDWWGIPECRVLVRPEDLPRAKEIAQSLADKAADVERVRRIESTSEVLYADLDYENAAAIAGTLQATGIPAFPLPAGDGGGDSDSYVVRVVASDVPMAQEIMGKISAAAHEAAASASSPGGAADPTTGAGAPPAATREETSVQFSIFMLVVLGVLAFLIMKSCS